MKKMNNQAEIVTTCDINEENSSESIQKVLDAMEEFFEAALSENDTLAEELAQMKQGITEISSKLAAAVEKLNTHINAVPEEPEEPEEPENPEEPEEPEQPEEPETPDLDKMISISSYYSYSVNGTDWTNAITKAEQDARAQKKDLYFPSGTYEVKNYLTKLSGVNWYGDNKKARLFVGDDFVFRTSAEGYGPSRYVMQNEHMWANTSEDNYDTFIIDGITLESCFTVEKFGEPFTSGDYNANWVRPEGWCKFTCTKNVIINNCSIVQDYVKTRVLPCRGIDFFGANVDTKVTNCYFAYNSANHKWGSFTFRNYFYKRTKGILIEDNIVIRRCGIDEPGWICANVGDIEDIIVRGNRYECQNSEMGISGVIDIQQGDHHTDVSSGTHHVSNVLIENNTIIVNSLMHNAIRVGSYIKKSTNSNEFLFVPIDQAIVRGNTITCKKTPDSSGQSYPSYGIIVENCKIAKIVNNTIKGTPKTFIYGGYTSVVEGNTITEDARSSTDSVQSTAVAFASEVSNNTINVSVIGLKGCKNVHDNTISSCYHLATEKAQHTYKNNDFTKKWPTNTSISKNYFAFANNATGSLARPVFNISGGTITGYGTSTSGFGPTTEAYRCDFTVSGTKLQ